MVLRVLGGLLRRAARPPAAEPEKPPAAAPARALLREWLAGDTYPPYDLHELLADPLRARVAELIAGRGDVEELQRLLGELLARADASAVDRMLLAEALLSRGAPEQAYTALLDVVNEPGVMGARASAKLVSLIYYQGEFARAGELIKQAMRYAPEAMYCRIFMATMTDYEGDERAALVHYRRAVALRPAAVDARVALAMGLLRCGELQEGFFQWVIAEVLAGEYTRAARAPVWDGRPLGTARVLLLTSNFYGDVMQMLRFASHLREREPRARLCVQIQPGLTRLAAASGLFERVHSGPIESEDFDFQASLTQLPLHLRTRLLDLRRHEPYLRIPPERIEQAAAWLPPRREGRVRVGLRWYGRAQYHNAKRSVPFELLRPLFAVPGIDWVALTEDAAMLADLGEHPLLDVCAHLADFCDTGALMSHLDLTISVDTSIAHLAGALDLPFWLLAQPDPEWRWGRYEETSLWYGSARCFRHKHDFDWEAMVREVAAALAGFVRGERVQPAAVAPPAGAEDASELVELRRAARARAASPQAHLALAAGLLRAGEIQEGLHAWVLAEHLAGTYRDVGTVPAWDGRPLGGDRLLIVATDGALAQAWAVPLARRLREREAQARLHLLVPTAGIADGLFEQVHVGRDPGEATDWQVSLPHLALLLNLGADELRGFEPPAS